MDDNNTMSLDELNPRIQDKFAEYFNNSRELDKLSLILKTIEDNIHLFDKYEHKISVTFRGAKVI